jgi:hypothetical protein
MWRSRFIDHPIGGLFGRRLVWVVAGYLETGAAALPVDEGWIGVDGRPLPESRKPRRVGLWHPADASADEIAGWRVELATRRIDQPVRQVDREAFRPEDLARDLVADRRYGGRVVDHARLRALLRGRGWAVPALGAWDQGDEATAWRAFDDDIRAELRYQGVERVPTGERVERARLVAIRFVESLEPSAAAASRDAVSIPLALVPPRAYSEAVRDVSLVVAVAELPGG